MSASRLLRRAAALGLLVLLLAMTVEAVILPVRGAFLGVESDRALAVAAIERLALRVRDRATFEDQIAALETEVAASDLWVRAETPALAAAAVQRRLETAAEAAGVEIVSTQSLPPGGEDDAGQVALRADLRASTEALAVLLHDVETGRPFLFVDRLRMRNLRGGVMRMAAETGPAELSVQLDLIAYTPEGAGS